MEDELMGMVQRFVADRVPRGWHACDGARLSVRGNEAPASAAITKRRTFCPRNGPVNRCRPSRRHRGLDIHS